MRMRTSQVEAIAASLHAARRSCAPVNFITTDFPDLTWADARAIARETDELRRTEGDIQIGWKLGWTSAVMREALGVDRPNWGTLWESQRCDGQLELADYLHPKIEPELVWKAGGDLASDCSADDLQAVGGSWALGIEVVDPRFPSFQFEALDNTADNSSSAAIRVGEFGLPQPDPAGQMVIFSDDADSRAGYGSQAMGDPAEAVAWLARSLAEEGLRVRAGDIVFTGGLTAPFDVQREVTYSLEAPPLGSIELRFT